MGVRALRARIECDRETLLHLWRTHCAFNQRLLSILTKLFGMRRGELGETAARRALYQRVARFLLARNATTMRTTSGPIARQVVLAEEHPCFAGCRTSSRRPIPIAKSITKSCCAKNEPISSGGIIWILAQWIKVG